jgi:Leucine-rich repeat (LRR) protein
VGNNYLVGITENIGNLSNLKYFYLNINRLIKIPSSIGNCKQLYELDVVRCGALVLPAELSELPRLELVYMDNRTTPFYQNPRYRLRQSIRVVGGDELLYRSSQSQ